MTYPLEPIARPCARCGGRALTLGAALLLLPGLATAQEVASERAGLVWLDWVIIFLYCTATIFLGWYYSRTQNSMSEYFLGSGAMHPFLIGVSLFATLLSTITYLSLPGEVAGKGPIYITTLLALPLVYPVVAYVVLPVYMKARVTSAYELLEAKLGLGIRLLGVSMFLALRLVWMSLLIYLMAKAMSKMMDLDESAIPWLVLVIGLITVTYTAMGGLRAVVITDLVQTTLMFGGAILVVIMISVDMGGFSWFPTTWQPHWDTQPIFSTDPSTRITLVGTVISVWVWYVCTSAGDQLSIQRFMATKDATDARRAFAIQLCASTCISLILFLVGFAVMGYFRVHPEFLPAGYDLKAHADDLYPRYISHHLPMGISGLVISAMFAAAMSSVDSGVNSITAVVMTDLMDRFKVKPTTERGHVITATILAFSIGAVVMIGSSFVGRIEGNITEVCGKTANLLVTPIFGLFFFAMFVPRANAPGVWIGWIFGMAAAILTGFSGEIFGLDPVTGNPPISFQWIPVVSLAANLIVGYPACILFDRVRRRELAIA